MDSGSQSTPNHGVPQRVWRWLLIALACLAGLEDFCRAGSYQNFTVSTYIMQRTVDDMMAGRLAPKASLDFIRQRLALDKIYIETMRNNTMVDEAGVEKLKKIYQDAGLQVCGGLAYSVTETHGYTGFDYADPKDRAFVKAAAEMAARHFDEILLDDYFFFDRKTDFDIAAKGDRSWTQFRLDTMRDVAENLIVKPAHAVNPKCKVIIKFANWYDQWHSMGNDTEKTPLVADGMYCGTESRLWVGQEQHLLPYQSYEIMRFMDNLRPGVARGGWVDLGGSNPVDRYAEQLWDTVFAKRPEMTCFEYTAMLTGLRDRTIHRPWENSRTSLDLTAMRKELTERASTEVADNPSYSGVAGYALRQADSFLGKLGNPVGVKSYTPYHATGEEFLHDYFGMIGVPQDVFPQFPTDASMVFLTEQAAADPQIVEKIKKQLTDGKSVAITSGLLKALQGRGIDSINEVEATGRSVLINRLATAGGPGAANRGTFQSTKTDHDILVPEIHYWNILTHDAWGDLSGVSPGGTTYPLIVSGDYSKGVLYALTIPNDPADLFALPQSAIDTIRSVLTRDEPIRLEDAPAHVALFRYDNNTAIVQNYSPSTVTVTITFPAGTKQLVNLLSGETIDEAAAEERRPASMPATTQRSGFAGLPGPSSRPDTDEGPKRGRFTMEIPPHSYVPVGEK